MGKLVRMLAGDGSVMVCVIDATDIVSSIEQIHHSSAVVTAALGRLTAAAALMGSLLKGENDSLTLRVNGNGPIGQLIAVSDSKGHVKADVQNPVVELPLNSQGKLDVGKAVGKNGFLSVVRDLHLKEPYVGQTPLVSGEIAEDIANYYAVSEQVPAACGLGVLVNPDLSVKAAGGYLLQLLPFATDECIEKADRNVHAVPPVSSLIDRSKTPEEIGAMLLQGFSPEVLETREVVYHCDCGRERVRKVLRSLKKQELIEMRDEDKGCEVCCHFCKKKYSFSEKELDELIQKK